MNFKGTQTEKNLKAALAGESMATNRYTFFAERAEKDGLEEVAALFKRLAKNEKEHARLWYKLLYGNVLDAKENLKKAAEGDREEWTDMYMRFAEEARSEGFEEVAQIFLEVKRIERNHEREILRTLNRVENNIQDEVVKETSSNMWVCGQCGFSGESKEKPEKCPLCKHTLIIL